jgi:hypothetical protein
VADLLRALDGYERALESVGVGPLKAAPLDLQEQARLAVAEERAKAQSPVSAQEPAQAEEGAEAPADPAGGSQVEHAPAGAGLASGSERTRQAPERGTVEVRPASLAPRDLAPQADAADALVNF